MAIWSHLLLHLELDVVEDSIEVHWIELHRHLDSWVLLEMDHRGIALFLIDHGSRALDLLPLFWSDLLAIKDKQLDQTLDDNYTVVGLASDWISDH